MFNSWMSKKKKAMFCSIGWFLWWKYPYPGQFQAIVGMSLNTELGRAEL